MSSKIKKSYQRIHISFIVLFASAVISLYWSICSCYDTDCRSSIIAFSLIAFSAILGVCRLTRNRMSKSFTIFTFVASIYVLPLLAIDMYRYCYTFHPWYYIHLCYPGVGFLLAMINRKASCPQYRRIPNKPRIVRNERFCAVDMVNIVSLISYGFVSCWGSSTYGTFASLAYFLSYILKSPAGNNICIATIDNHNLIMSVFTLCAAKALIDAMSVYSEVRDFAVQF